VPANFNSAFATGIALNMVFVIFDDWKMFSRIAGRLGDHEACAPIDALRPIFFNPP